MLSYCNDTLDVASLTVTSVNVTPIVLPINVSSTQQTNHLICDVNETITVTPNIILEPPSQANAKLADLTASIANVGVNNISSYIPSVDEQRILALGLNFIPEPKDITNFEVYQTLDEYTDSILWKEQLDYVGSSIHRDTSNSVVAKLRRKLRTKLYHKRNTSDINYKNKERGYVKRRIDINRQYHIHEY